MKYSFLGLFLLTAISCFKSNQENTISEQLEAESSEINVLTIPEVQSEIEKQEEEDRSNESFSTASESLKSPISYYKKIDFSLESDDLLDELSGLVRNTHKRYLSYYDLWRVLKNTDKNPDNSKEVLLIYGYDNSGDESTDLSRGAYNKGGGQGQWNREHVYPKSKGQPNLGTEGPGADAHMVRPSDVSRNSKRGNLPFEDAEGNSHRVSNSWYPGDRWKGDVARIMMYMYLRYGDRCDPSRVAKSRYSYSDDMPDLFLDWNVEDPVDAFEARRNDLLDDIQGNRNPFIDNPYLATKIWGGKQAENLWD